MQSKGTALEDIVDQLRCRTVPAGYPFHKWNEGMSCIAFASRYAKCMVVSMCVIQCHVHTTCIVDEHNNFCILDKEKEDIVDKLKSILAQLEYTHEIRKWQEASVPFHIHFYVPECHPEIGETFLESSGGSRGVS